MDFPGNTIKQREWFTKIVHESRADHTLYYLDVSDEICLKQIQERRLEDPTRHGFDTEEVFQQISAYFQEPFEEEGLLIKQITIR
jgi:thymidylate kinase